MSTHVAIAFTTTGPDFKGGHRFKELVAVKEAADGKALLTIHATDTDGTHRFAEMFPALCEFVGSAPVVIYKMGQWRGFLRAEYAGIDRKAGRTLMKAAVEAAGWSSKCFPKQRKSPEHVAQRLGVAQDLGDATGVAREAELLYAIGKAMMSSGDNKVETDDAAQQPNGIQQTEPASTESKSTGRGLLGLKSRLGGQGKKN